MIKKGHTVSTCDSEVHSEESAQGVTNSAFLPEFDGQIRRRECSLPLFYHASDTVVFKHKLRCFESKSM